MSENLATENVPDTKERLHEIIFEADTPAGKVFNIALFIVIIASIIFVMLESVEEIDRKFHGFLGVCPSTSACA